MSGELAALAGRIRSELVEVDRLARRIREAWDHAERTGDDLYLDSVALNLHGVYGALERVFELIASTTGEPIPEGHDWHQKLLEQMASEVPGTRPAAISSEVKEALTEFRGFRHVARNVYAFHLDRAKLATLVNKLPKTNRSVAEELGAFASFLEADELRER